MKKNRGFTVIEIVLAIAIGAIILALVTIGGNRALAQRSLNTTSMELEGVLRNARQAAPNAGGAKVLFNQATPTSKANWQVLLGTRLTNQHEMDRGLQVTLSPSSPQAIEFTGAGTLAEDRQITLSSSTTGSSISWKIYASTGAVERLP
ncbi:MAG: prepilin-type N-terminal cleavage/methylation domain-containing protein [Candidatus Xenobium sp.]|jgi:prepilin-type N-terminal cleavage/methylation domain-containing protein|nr:prepilin-type N-terminal cleavage/methylation domain-containing protein [Burkholderiales bacterium]